MYKEKLGKEREVAFIKGKRCIKVSRVYKG